LGYGCAARNPDPSQEADTTMLRINPFAALRPRPDICTRVASPPYDVINDEEARQIARQDAFSFIRVIRSEVDLPEGVDPHSDEVYERARQNLQQLQDDGALIREERPCIYLYQQRVKLLGKDVVQTGVVCCCNIEDYDLGRIKKHEKTREDKEDDRTRHLLTLDANAGPVFLLYKGRSELDSLIDRAVGGEPLYDFTASDDVRHTVWRVEDHAAYVEAFKSVEAAYIADGHHRSASASRAGAERKARNPGHTGDEEYNWFLTVLFPAKQLSILPYHRVVKDLNGLSPEQVLEKVKTVGEVAETDEPEPKDTGRFGMYLADKWYRITLPADSIDHDDPVGALDYVLLADRILHPILGIGDIRTDARIDFVGGIRGTGELEKRVDSGEMSIAFAMHACTIDQLLAVADAGLSMPPKSTWFEPKLRSGLLVHTLD
jgi:uncharacterized protein (DUF1015 family)